VQAGIGRAIGVVGALSVLAVQCVAATGQRSQDPDWSAARMTMVDSQIRARGVTHQRVLDAMRKVPRHLFVPEDQRLHAYDDNALPIGHEQTISQPYIVGYMSEALDPKPTDRVLEIGTGSGYQAAILAELVGEVYTIEIVAPLAERARTTLEELGYRNVHVRQGNGYLGWPEAAPFDKIIVTAAPEDVPPALVEQLRVGGVMVLPIGRGDQMMTVLQKTDQGVVSRTTLPVRFVPMVGKGRGTP
jgi:protein-L-isoaspartate(D-aspartate) O-methyltransferase